jgi:hypothetical protein
MNVGIAPRLVALARTHIGNADSLVQVARGFDAGASMLVDDALGARASIANARSAVAELRLAAPNNVHVDVNAGRVLRVLDEIDGRLAGDVLPTSEQFARARSFLDWIPS